ncbi:hypothetical protein D3C74_430850 [compost metagenome]
MLAEQQEPEPVAVPGPGDVAVVVDAEVVAAPREVVADASCRQGGGELDVDRHVVHGLGPVVAEQASEPAGAGGGAHGADLAGSG